MRNSFRTPGRSLIAHPIRPIDRHAVTAGLEYLVDEPENLQGRTIYAPGPHLGYCLARQVDGFPVNLVGVGTKLEQV